ncbi:DNA-binding transcriptional LysR family regulator [Rhodobium orientis]|uniref:LysR family transcriptional regulator n=1 Tax=Rhodobium orientis TaxID=34017 RepID=A0A327JMK8_9HYPH|nr:LysR family transcriptional regulator [Rhodobium orientis]MBB4301427.1 DNA-binding transcriptional LysR family regulator [Rhodobium orientis]MBK5950985.1 LysR family transcriptional regulator [Rhodobium orientis]RAI27649.1 LysR family transcriptional regulator [Rhodobium orientis]
MNWDDARMFLAVARAGQILAASRNLGITQTTLSRRVAALETSLGTKLVIRRTQGCDLTEAGVDLMESLERVEAEFLASRARLDATTTAISGTVRIAAPDGFGVAFLAPRLGALSERYPKLRVQLVPTPRSFSLSRREADIAVLIDRPEKGRLRERKLIDYTLGLYASRGYLERCPPPANAAGLSHHRLVGYVDDLIYAPGLNYASEFLRNWRSRIEISSAIGQLAAIRGGAGIGILHDYVARPEADLVRVLPTLSARRSYWLVTHENLHDIPRVKAAADFIVEAVHRERAQFAAA